MQELDHQAGKALERAWNSNSGADFDEDSFGCVDVDL